MLVADTKGDIFCQFLSSDGFTRLSVLGKHYVRPFRWNVFALNTKSKTRLSRAEQNVFSHPIQVVAVHFSFQKHLLLVTELLLYFLSIVRTSKYVPTKVGKIKLTKDKSITLGHCLGMNEPSSSLDFLAKRICGCKLTKYVNLFGYEKKSQFQYDGIFSFLLLLLLLLSAT